MAVLCLFLLLFVFMFLGVPIAISLGLSGAVSILMFSQDSVSSLAIKLFETSDAYTFLAFPSSGWNCVSAAAGCRRHRPRRRGHRAGDHYPDEPDRGGVRRVLARGAGGQDHRLQIQGGDHRR